MQLTNRRSFIRNLSMGAAVLGVAPARLASAQGTSDRMYESEITGSVVEITNPDWSFSTDHIEIREEADFISEYVMIYGVSGNFEVEFVQASLSPAEYLDHIQSLYKSNYEGFELADSGTTPDGAWFAASAVSEILTMSIYCEYQVGAYDDTDLVVRFNSRPGLFRDGISAAQSDILVGDMEPMVMMQQSEVRSLVFPLPAKAVATSAPGTDRTGRSTRSASGTDTTSSSGSNRTGQNETVPTTDRSYVDAVRTHRTDFMVTFEDFAAAMGVFVDESRSDAELDAAFDEINRVTNIWLTYTSQAGQITAPAEYASLESLYLTWADEIAALGQSWVDAVSGRVDVAVMFDQIDVVNQADNALAAELNSL